MIQEKKNNTANIIFVIGLLVLIFVLEQIMPSSSMLFTVIKKSAIYALAAVSMNLLNGFTGLFSLGQAGFMLVGAYVYGMLNIPVADRAAVYQYFDGGLIQFSFVEGISNVLGPVPGLILGVLMGLVVAGVVAAVFAWLIGLPVLRFKSDYLAIATLGFAEIIRAVFQWDVLGPVTNGSNLLRKFPVFHSTFAYFIVVGICVAVILLLINSSYGRAFKAIREDEIAAEAMGINLTRHKMLAFCISSFFAGIGGALLAMYQTSVQAGIFKSAMTYEILLIVVIGGIGSISGSVIASFLYIACSEWWLRFLDQETILQPQGRMTFIIVMAVIFVALLAMMVYKLIKVKDKPKLRFGVGAGVCGLVLVWLVSFAITGQTKVPLLRSGFRMVVFSVIIVIIVLFFSRGIMGTKELPELFKKRVKKAEEVAK